MKVRKTPAKKKKKTENESLSCFLALSSDVINLNRIWLVLLDQFDILFYSELSHDFNRLQHDMTSLCMNNKPLKLKVSFSLKEIKALEDNDEKSKANEEKLKRENKKLQAQLNNLNLAIL